MPDGVLFVERSGELCILCEVKDKKSPEPQKPSLKEGANSQCVQTRPGDLLSMSELEIA